MDLDRREFLAALARFGAGAAMALYAPGRLFGATPAVPAAAGAAGAAGPDLVAVRNAAPDRLFAAGIKALGGMGRFVKKGAVVVVKPNIGWDVGPELAANTNPRLVKAIVEAALAAGAKKVYVFDHTCDSWRAAYRNSGIEAAAKEAGASVAPADAESYYGAVSPKGATLLRSVKVHELILEADVFINAPVLKSHGGAGMTAAMKNLMGAVWDRGAFHSLGLDRAIAEAGLAARPTLNVIDASKVMLSGGPRGNPSSRYAELGMQILSTDPVAADAAAAKAFGPGPAAYPYIKAAAGLGLGRYDLEALAIERITL